MTALWERRYRAAADDPTQFGWYRDHLDAHVLASIERTAAADGVAVDVGCGPGVALGVLADRFGAAVGLDLSMTAVRGARTRTAALVGVAAAPSLPVRTASCHLVVDRGCLHALDRSMWPAHLAEIARVLAPGGEVAMSNHTIVAADLPSVVPPTLEVVETCSFEEVTGHDHPQQMLGMVLRRI